MPPTIGSVKKYVEEKFNKLKHINIFWTIDEMKTVSVQLNYGYFVYKRERNNFSYLKFTSSNEILFFK